MSLPLKRKAVEGNGSSGKKPCKASNKVDGGEDAEDSGFSTDCDEFLQDEDHENLSALTPSTPISSKSTPASKPRPKNHHCPFPSCGKAYTRPVRLDEHIRSHTNDRSYVCPEPSCGKSYLRDSHLKHHVKSAHTSIRDYICNWSGCSKAFQTGTRLERHIAAHEGKEKFRCRIEGCGLTFRKHGTLQKHTRSVHEGLKPYICATLVVEKAPTGSSEIACNAAFDTAAKLKAHRTRMHSDNRFTCDICAESNSTHSNADGDDMTLAEFCFDTYSLLQSHVKTAHPPTCPQCSAVLPSSSALSSHIEIYHEMSLTERQSHFCPEPQCGRGFTRAGNLVCHLKTVHQNKREFVCGESDISGSKSIPEDWSKIKGCGLTFAAKGNLVGHFKTVHLGDRRKNKKIEKPRMRAKTSSAATMTKEPSDLVRSLTSRGNEEQSLACLEPFCFAVFYDTDALFVHLLDVHGIAGGDVDGQQDHGESRPPDDENSESEDMWGSLHGQAMDAEDEIAERALSALREELQRESLPIDPTLA